MARRKKTANRSEELRSTVPVNIPATEHPGGPIEYYLIEFFSFVRDNLKETVLVVVALLLLIIGGAVYYSFNQQARQDALADFEKLLNNPVMALGSRTDRKAIEKLEEYLKTHSDTASRRRAEIHLLDYYADAKDFIKAAELAVRLAQDLDLPEQRAYFHLRAGIYYENAARYSLAQESYARVSSFLREESYPRAVAVFGEARCLIRIGRRADGLTKMKELLAMDKVENIDRLRAQAAAFLATPAPTPGPK